MPPADPTTRGIRCICAWENAWGALGASVVDGCPGTHPIVVAQRWYLGVCRANKGHALQRDLRGHGVDGNRWATENIHRRGALKGRLGRASSPRCRRGRWCNADFAWFSQLCARGGCRGRWGTARVLPSRAGRPEHGQKYGVHGREDRMLLRGRVHANGGATGWCGGSVLVTAYLAGVARGCRVPGCDSSLN